MGRGRNIIFLVYTGCGFVRKYYAYLLGLGFRYHYCPACRSPDFSVFLYMPSTLFHKLTVKLQLDTSCIRVNAYIDILCYGSVYFSLSPHSYLSHILSQHRKSTQLNYPYLPRWSFHLRSSFLPSPYQIPYSNRKCLRECLSMFLSRFCVWFLYRIFLSTPMGGLCVLGKRPTKESTESAFVGPT